MRAVWKRLKHTKRQREIILTRHFLELNDGKRFVGGGGGVVFFSLVRIIKTNSVKKFKERKNASVY